MWNEDFYEINNVNENQLILVKIQTIHTASSTDDYGTSLSIIVSANYVRPERFGIQKQRL
jgi:hypothetical protein